MINESTVPSSNNRAILPRTKKALHRKKEDRLLVLPLDLPIFSPDDIVKLRISLNMTQKEFSQIFGVKERAITRWELGQVDPPGSAQKLFYLISKNQDILHELVSVEKRP